MKALLVLCFIFLFFPDSFAKTHPYDKAAVTLLRKNFYAEDGLSREKLANHRQRIEQKIQEISALIGDDVKAEKSDSVVALKLASNLLQRMSDSQSEGEQYKLGIKFMELEGAVRIQGDDGPLRNISDIVTNGIKRWTLPFKSPLTDEASDLFDPKTGEFLAPEDMRNKDLSLYDPDLNGPFWRAPGKPSIYDGVDLSFPTVNIVEFDEVKHSDTKPKMNVFIRTAGGKKMKYKLKVGAEIHADPTLGAIIARLGFGTDRTKFMRDIRLNLGKKKLKDLLRDWETYYRRDGIRSYKFETYVRETGTDEKGDFVIFREALLEAKPSELSRVGGWSFSEFGHTGLRAVRALTLIQMWLDNTDIKEFGNNRVLVKGDESFNIISDLGKSLGGLVGEKPELLNPVMVSGKSSSGLTFNFRTTQPNGIKNTFTFADARWTGRLMATLTRAEITDAVYAGGWPACVAKIYVEKIISRRNDFVKNMRLIGERDRNGNVISEIPLLGSLSFQENCSRSELEDSSIDFDFSYGSFAKPIIRSALNSLVDLGTNTINQTRHITLSGVEAGFDAGVISQLILNLRREVERNPDPKSFEDLYIVRDHFEFGMRLGVSYGIYKDYVYTRSFTLAYPVRAIEEARYNNGFVVNLLLPRDVMNGILPQKYVLQTDHYFEKGIGVEVDDLTNPVSPSLRIKTSRVRIMRTILDHKKSDRVILYRDRTDYAELFLRGFVRLGILKLPLLTTFSRWGQAAGAGVIISGDEAKSLDVRRAIVEGDFSTLAERERNFALRNNFREQEFNWNLVFWRGSNTGRYERISIENDGDAQEFLQYRTSRNRSWSLFGKSEKRSTSVEVIAGEKSADYQLKVTSLCLDSSTSDDELQDEYLSFINGLSPDGARIIPFTPRLGYSTNKRWGKIEARSETTYYGEAIGKILVLQEDHFWDSLALHLRSNRSVLNDVRTRVKEAQEEMSTSRVANRSAVLRSYNLNSSDFELIRNSESFVKGLHALKKEKAVTSKLKKLGSLFRSISSNTKDSRILGTVNRIVGDENFFSTNVVAPPLFAEINMIEGIPLVGERGKARPDENGYLHYLPATPLELYHVFGNWRLKP